MDISFVGQGLDPDSYITAGDLIIESLGSDNYATFNAFVAFVSTSGLNNILDQLVDFKEKGGEVRLYLGVNLHATSKEALEKLLEYEIESYVIYSPNSIIYHPKIYAFEGTEYKRAIIGSSNLTASGLFQNIEASVCVDFESSDKSGNEFLTEIYEHFNTVINQEHPSCQLLTQEILDILIESNTVLAEAISREKNNKINKEFGKKEQKINTQLLDLFGKIKAKKLPKGYKKTVTKQSLISDDETTTVNIVTETTDLVSGSMWIETSKMTGGSRNILDLSKKGKRDGDTKFGSLSYFGLDPDSTESSKDIDVTFEGNIYKSNRIFYTEGNSNWRIRLNGKTDGGKNITAFSKPNLGENGGFQYKILVFSKIDDTKYMLEILDKEELDKLIEYSSDWARGGNETTGRAYGIIK